MINETIITFRLQDQGGKEGQVKVVGERNGEIIFEENFSISSDKPVLRLHLLKEKFTNILKRNGNQFKNDSLTKLCLRKLTKDILDNGKLTS